MSSPPLPKIFTNSYKQSGLSATIATQLSRLSINSSVPLPKTINEALVRIAGTRYQLF